MKDPKNRLFEEERDFTFNLLVPLLKGTENACSITSKLGYPYKRSTQVQKRISTLKEEGYLDGDRRTPEKGNKGYGEGYKLNVKFLFWHAEKLKIPFLKTEKKILNKIFDNFDLEKRKEMTFTAIHFESVKKSCVYSLLYFFNGKRDAYLKKNLLVVMKLIILAQPEYVKKQKPLTTLICNMEQRIFNSLSKKKYLEYEKWMNTHYIISDKEQETVNRLIQTAKFFSKFND